MGLKLRNAGRASSLFWLGFGEMISVSRKGETEETAEYALHIQCSWRIIKENKILVASRDFYSPRSGWNEDNEDFDWDIQGTIDLMSVLTTFWKAYKKTILLKALTQMRLED
ncbi:hypothetical protein M3226_24505 [Neobacillus cucumis]|uniref:hypothetical protein n=1 Tax=Neobacillus cucumis TaxID=1740721 RepID=UPI00203B20F9|nr:hypothetical protein [Neobacillus cucumis]MCM3728808.1 hypothetical protein [Neobacillus cucumis]